MRLILTSFNPQVHHEILAQPKPVRPISTTNQRRLVVVVGQGGGFGHALHFLARATSHSASASGVCSRSALLISGLFVPFDARPTSPITCVG